MVTDIIADADNTSTTNNGGWGSDRAAAAAVTDRYDVPVSANLFRFLIDSSNKKGQSSDSQ
jgi:hypothetical protein